MEKTVKVVGFRVDIAAHIGTGHLQRCITLAKQLKSSSIRCIFFVRKFENDFLGIIGDSGFEYVVIGQPTEYEFSDDHFYWLGVSQEQDAQELIEAASHYSLALLIIDHYSIDSIWETAVKKKLALPILVIDDLANRKHNCEILLDQNYWPNMDIRYKGLIPNNCQCFFGPTYALLKPIFEQLSQDNVSFKHTSNIILVNFGGVGNFSLWQVVIPALLECNNFNFHIVTGRLSAENYTNLSALVKSSPYINIEELTNRMPELMKGSIYSLGACGSTVWERFCLGLNSGLIDIAENQKELVRYLEEQDLIDYLGSLETITTEDIMNFLNNLQSNSQKYITRKNKIQALVDGLGPKKIADQIIKIIN